jgi:hypothetical protein
MFWDEMMLPCGCGEGIAYSNMQSRGSYHVRIDILPNWETIRKMFII